MRTKVAGIQTCIVPRPSHVYHLQLEISSNFCIASDGCAKPGSGVILHVHTICIHSHSSSERGGRGHPGGSPRIRLEGLDLSHPLPFSPHLPPCTIHPLIPPTYHITYHTPRITLTPLIHHHTLLTYHLSRGGRIWLTFVN